MCNIRVRMLNTTEFNYGILMSMHKVYECARVSGMASVNHTTAHTSKQTTKQLCCRQEPRGRGDINKRHEGAVIRGCSEPRVVCVWLSLCFIYPSVTSRHMVTVATRTTHSKVITRHLLNRALDFEIIP